ncbi:hypothetical protein BDZ97DRAFT_1761980 [Flammula alnicola]|nr:hypothetical protein BDZ97DRAFT_1761980 [Flammula alnicola]
MSLAWTAETRSGYGTGLLVFHVFCDNKTPPVPDHLRGPASEALILEFKASCAASFGGDSLNVYVCGVKAWHTVHGLPWTTGKVRLKTALMAATKLAPDSSKRPERPPVLLRNILAIHRHLNSAVGLDAAVYACLTTTFWACARLGEFTIAKHKGEDVHWAPQSGPTDPAAALANHMRVNTPPPSGHLFAYKHTDGSYRPLTRNIFLRRIATAAKDAGDDAIQGHSIRIGSVLEYILRGMPFEAVKVHGRWSSDAFLKYLRKHANILAPYLQDTPAIEQFIRYTLRHRAGD